MNPINQNTKELTSYFMDFDKLYPKAYNKNKTHPYTKTRVILMNGTEYESVRTLSKNFQTAKKTTPRLQDDIIK